MFYRIMTTGFQNIVETYYIRLDISIGIDDAIPHTCLGGKVYYNGYFILCENLFNSILVCY